MRRNNRRNVNVSVAYTVTTPAGNTPDHRLDLRFDQSRPTSKGNCRPTRSAGPYAITNGGRIAAAKSISGDVEIIDTQTDGAIEAKSISGGVTVRKVAARRIDVGSVSGAIAVQDVTMRSDRGALDQRHRRVRRYARQGRPVRIEFAFRRRAGGARGRTGFEVEANSFSGSIHSDLPLKIGGSDDRRCAAVRFKVCSATAARS